MALWDYPGFNSKPPQRRSEATPSSCYSCWFYELLSTGIVLSLALVCHEACHSVEARAVLGRWSVRSGESFTRIQKNELRQSFSLNHSIAKDSN